MKRHPPESTPFPYTTLFRSVGGLRVRHPVADRGADRLLQGAGARLDRHDLGAEQAHPLDVRALAADRKSTRLNSSHGYTSYAVFRLKKQNPPDDPPARSPSD